MTAGHYCGHPAAARRPWPVAYSYSAYLTVYMYFRRTHCWLDRTALLATTAVQSLAPYNPFIQRCKA